MQCSTEKISACLRKRWKRRLFRRFSCASPTEQGGWIWRRVCEERRWLCFGWSWCWRHVSSHRARSAFISSELWEPPSHLRSKGFRRCLNIVCPPIAPIDVSIELQASEIQLCGDFFTKLFIIMVLINIAAFGRELYVASARNLVSSVPLWLEQRCWHTAALPSFLCDYLYFLSNIDLQIVLNWAWRFSTFDWLFIQIPWRIGLWTWREYRKL